MQTCSKIKCGCSETEMNISNNLSYAIQKRRVLYEILFTYNHVHLNHGYMLSSDKDSGNSLQN